MKIKSSFKLILINFTRKFFKRINITQQEFYVMVVDTQSLNQQNNGYTNYVYMVNKNIKIRMRTHITVDTQLLNEDFLK